MSPKRFYSLIWKGHNIVIANKSLWKMRMSCAVLACAGLSPDGVILTQNWLKMLNIRSILPISLYFLTQNQRKCHINNLIIRIHFLSIEGVPFWTFSLDCRKSFPNHINKCIFKSINLVFWKRKKDGSQKLSKSDVLRILNDFGQRLSCRWKIILEEFQW